MPFFVFFARMGQTEYNHHINPTWIRKMFESHQIEQGWQFNSLEALHIGGASERLLKNCNRAMYVVLEKRSVTEVVLLTAILLLGRHCLQKCQLQPAPSLANEWVDHQPAWILHFCSGCGGHRWDWWCSLVSDSLNKRQNDCVSKRPVVKLAPVITREGVFGK